MSTPRNYLGSCRVSCRRCVCGVLFHRDVCIFLLRTKSRRRGRSTLVFTSTTLCAKFGSESVRLCLSQTRHQRRIEETGCDRQKHAISGVKFPQFHGLCVLFAQGMWDEETMTSCNTIQYNTNFISIRISRVAYRMLVSPKTYIKTNHKV